MKVLLVILMGLFVGTVMAEEPQGPKGSPSSLGPAPDLRVTDRRPTDLLLFPNNGDFFVGMEYDHSRLTTDITSDISGKAGKIKSITDSIKTTVLYSTSDRIGIGVEGTVGILSKVGGVKAEKKGVIGDPAFSLIYRPIRKHVGVDVQITLKASPKILKDNENPPENWLAKNRSDYTILAQWGIQRVPTVSLLQEREQVCPKRIMGLCFGPSIFSWALSVGHTLHGEAKGIHDNYQSLTIKWDGSLALRPDAFWYLNIGLIHYTELDEFAREIVGGDVRFSFGTGGSMAIIKDKMFLKFMTTYIHGTESKEPGATKNLLLGLQRTTLNTRRALSTIQGTMQLMARF